MVYSINFSPINFKGSTNLITQYKSNQVNNNSSAPADKSLTASGTDALSNYNKVAIKPANSQKVDGNAEEKALALVSDLKPTEPTHYDIANLNAEEVKSSDGTNAYYEEKNGDISKIYKFYKDKLDSVIEIDNQTGNMIKKESTSFFDREKISSINEFDPKTGKEIKTTIYDEKTGKLACVIDSSKGERSVSYDENGKVKNISLIDDGIDGGANVWYSFENGKLARRTVENKDGKVLEVNRYSDAKGISSIKPKLYPVINTSGIDYSKIDLKPSELGNVELDPSKVEGEKKYRSNGTLEKVVVKDGNLVRTYNMDYTGKKLGEIVESENGVDKREISFSDDNGEVKLIEEFDDKGMLQKLTSFEHGKPKRVMDTGNSSVTFFDDGKIQILQEWNSPTSGNVFEFDKAGNLIRCDEIDENRKTNKNRNTYYNKMSLEVENKTDSPDNAKSVDRFKAALNDPNWDRTYVEEPNIVHMKQKGVTDGIEYEIFSNGTVREYSNWGNDAIIMNSNQENADLFKMLSSLPKAIK